MFTKHITAQFRDVQRYRKPFDDVFSRYFSEENSISPQITISTESAASKMGLNYFSIEDKANSFCSMQPICQSARTAVKKKRFQGGKKSVSFSNLEIRTHSVVVGDHPHCKLPLSLGWPHVMESTVVPIDEYENMRPPRRVRNNLKMTYFERKNILKRIAGFTEKDILREERRSKSMQNLRAMH